MQISIYSHRAEVHDAITKVPGSLEAHDQRDSFPGLARVEGHDRQRADEADPVRLPGVQALAAELGANFTIDPTITPHINGDRSLLALNVDRAKTCAK